MPYTPTYEELEHENAELHFQLASDEECIAAMESVIDDCCEKLDLADQNYRELRGKFEDVKEANFELGEQADAANLYAKLVNTDYTVLAEAYNKLVEQSKAQQAIIEEFALRGNALIDLSLDVASSASALSAKAECRYILPGAVIKTDYEALDTLDAAIQNLQSFIHDSEPFVVEV